MVPRDIDAVVHLAVSMFPAAGRRTNVEGAQHVIAAARERKVRRFVYTSSALAYGPTDPSVLVAEHHPCRPVMRFARQQRQVEEALQALAASCAFPAVILRPSEVYGGDGGLLPGMVERLRRGELPLAGDGHQGISFTALEDLIMVITRCLDGDLPPGETLNVNAPGLVDAADLFDSLAERLGGPRPRRIPVPLVYAFGALAGAASAALRRPATFNLDIARLSSMRSGPRSVEKARRRLGFTPRDDDPRAAIEKLVLGV